MVSEAWRELAKEISIDLPDYHTYTKETGDMMHALLGYLLAHEKICMVPLSYEARPLVTGMDYTLYFARKKTDGKKWDIISEYPIPDARLVAPGLRGRQLHRRYIMFIDGSYNPRNVEQCENSVRAAIPAEAQEKFIGGVYVGKAGDAYRVDELSAERIFVARRLPPRQA